MSSAREAVDRLTEAIVAGDIQAVAGCYDDSAVVVAPEGTYKGLDQVTEYFRGWLEPFTGFSIDIGTKAEWENHSLDEWSLSATNSGDIEMPTGETVPATGRRVTVRGADVCKVRNGTIVEHHIYFDQVEFLGQLGLLPE